MFGTAGSARGFVHIHQQRVKLVAASSFQLVAGLQAVTPARQHALECYTQGRVQRATHPHIRLVCRAFWQHVGVGRGHMPVVAHDHTGPAIQVVANNELFAAKIAVQIHDHGNALVGRLVCQDFVDGFELFSEFDSAGFADDVHLDGTGILHAGFDLGGDVAGQLDGRQVVDLLLASRTPGLRGRR
jgi:hypothetical protein